MEISTNPVVVGVIIAGLVSWITAIAISTLVGLEKNAGPLGFIAGFLFGPMGILVAALAIDGRMKCPSCLERVNAGAKVCAACRLKLDWSKDGDDQESTTPPPPPPNESDVSHTPAPVYHLRPPRP